jgi:hypothetical protein
MFSMQSPPEYVEHRNQNVNLHSPPPPDEAWSPAEDEMAIDSSAVPYTHPSSPHPPFSPTYEVSPPLFSDQQLGAHSLPQSVPNQPQSYATNFLPNLSQSYTPNDGPLVSPPAQNTANPFSLNSSPVNIPALFSEQQQQQSPPFVHNTNVFAFQAHDYYMSDMVTQGQENWPDILNLNSTVGFSWQSNRHEFNDVTQMFPSSSNDGGAVYNPVTPVLSFLNRSENRRFL